MSIPEPRLSLPLPTVEEAQEALRLINLGRVADGRPPLEFLDFDNATPCDPNNCLSARNLFAEAGYNVHSRTIWANPLSSHLAVVAAIGAEETSVWRSQEYLIPAAILAITAPFDEEVVGLRERLVEAGVVEP